MDSVWSSIQPRLIVTSDTEDFDVTIVQHFQEEGFQVAYLAYAGDKAAYQDQLQHLADYLEIGEQYAIVAYGDAATQCLEACLSPMPRLVGIVAYYPPSLPNTAAAFPPSIDVLIHLAGSQTFGTRYPSHRYPGTEEGFAEHDLEEFDGIAASLAWSRTIGCLSRSFRMQPDLELVVDNHARLEVESKSVSEIMKTMVGDPYLTHVPTMTSAIGPDEVEHFYEDRFSVQSPPDLKFKLLSRTVGTDRVVDEVLVTFTHSHLIPWMLPCVPPTGKKVEVILVIVACIRGRKLYHKHIHWDQATVLVQIGLLDPNLIPNTFSMTQESGLTGIKLLPVRGAEAARKLVNKLEQR